MFAGGCTLEAAEQVRDTDPDLLQSLLDKSLVRRRDGQHGARYWMLETIREHASEQLAALGEEDAVRDRHTDWMLGLLEAAGPREDVPFSSVAYERLAVEEADNLRVAITRAVERQPDRAAVDAGIAGITWAATTDLREGYAIVTAMGHAVPDPPASALVGREAALGWLACLLGDIDAALRHTHTAIDADPECEYGPWSVLAHIAKASTSLYVAGDDPLTPAERALRLAEERRQPYEIAFALITFGYVHGVRGEHQASRQYYERAAEIAAEYGFLSLELNARINVGSILLEDGGFEQAEALFAAMLPRFAAEPMALYSAGSYACRGYGESLAGRRASREAAMLISSADSELGRTGIYEDASEARLRVEALDRIRAVIGQDELGEALAAGSVLPLGEAIKLAITLGTPPRDG